ncbi:MAG: ATP-dependent zinc metalloprotease FtsH [Bacillota bacterium]
MKNNKGFYFTVLIILVAVMLFSSYGGSIFGTSSTELEYTEFLELVKSGEIVSVYVDGDYDIYGYTSASGTTASYSSVISSRLFFDTDFKDVNGDYIVNIEYSNPNDGAWLSSMLPTIIMLVMGGVLIYFMFKTTQGGGAAGMGKSRAKVQENSKVRFTDVAGAEEEKEELKEIVEFLKRPKDFSGLGAKIPKGVLLVGPPGTGKTLFAKAVAGEANVPFFSISGSDFVEMYVGVGAKRVRELFDQAKKNMPCIVFIDEIDAVGRQRGAGMGGGNDEREQTLNQLLVEMDGFNDNMQIVIIAATNRSDVLDPALMRPGRFDRQIVVNRPDVRGREAIFKVHARNKPLSDDISFKHLARITSGCTGADIANLLNEAAILATRKHQKTITMADVNEAINKVFIGPQKKSRIVTAYDKRITAYHEAGHAILAMAIEGNDPVHEVSIIPRGMAAGYTMTRPDGDDSHVSKSKLLAGIIMTLGGRAAEQVIIKDICTGASSDLQHATETAHAMVCEWGMSEKVGLINLGGSQEVFLGRDYQNRTSYSESLASIVDGEIRKILDDCYKIAVDTLTEKKNVLNNMAKLLIERETIFEEEVQMLMAEKPYEEFAKYYQDQELKIKNNIATEEIKPVPPQFPMESEEESVSANPQTIKDFEETIAKLGAEITSVNGEVKTEENAEAEEKSDKE